MIERLAEASPQFKARIAGVFYLLTILTGAFALVVVSGHRRSRTICPPTTWSPASSAKDR